MNKRKSFDIEESKEVPASLSKQIRRAQTENYVGSSDQNEVIKVPEFTKKNSDIIHLHEAIDEDEEFKTESKHDSSHEFSESQSECSEMEYFRFNILNY